MPDQPTIEIRIQTESIRSTPALKGPETQRDSTSCRSLRGFLFARQTLCWMIAGLALTSLSCRKDSSEENQSAPANQVEAPFEFVDRTSNSGIVGTYTTGGEKNFRTMLETLGGGVGVIDFDCDGQPDLFFTGGGGFTDDQEIVGNPSFLFRNLSGWRFEQSIQETGISTGDLYSHGCQCGDLDNDGFPDLIVTGYGGLQVFRNMGDGSFSKIDCGIETDRWATSAALADFDGDGNLDLFVSNYLVWSFKNHRKCSAPNQELDVCSPRHFEGVVDELFTSQGDWTFKNDGAEKGITKAGKGLGVVTGDIDLDGDVDIYVACDVSTNLLYVNKGDGTFDELGAPAGVDLGDQSMPNGSMGVDLADFDNNGLPDIGVANFENEDFALYKQIKIANQPDSLIFGMASKATRLTATNQMYVGWGTLFEDFDADGDEDLVVNNGHLSYFPESGTMQQKPLFFQNAGRTFEVKNVIRSPYFDQPHFGRGCVAVDVDQDGDLDLVFSNCNENFAVLENKSPQKMPLTRVTLIGSRFNRDGLGWCLKGTDQTPLRMRKGGGSYLSSLTPDLFTAQSYDGKSQPEVLNHKDHNFTFIKEGNRIIGVECPPNG